MLLRSLSFQPCKLALSFHQRIPISSKFIAATLTLKLYHLQLPPQLIFESPPLIKGISVQINHRSFRAARPTSPTLPESACFFLFYPPSKV
jgi:hypothetical protein